MYFFGVNRSMTFYAASKIYSKRNTKELTNNSITTYIYVNKSINSCIKNILFNDIYVIYDILGNKRKTCPKDRLKTIESNLDLFSFVISSLYFSYVTDKRIKDENEFINLNSKILQSIIGDKRTAKIIHFLIQHGFIETDNHFIVGQKSKGYRFAPKWLALFSNNELKFHRKETKLKTETQYIDNFINSDYIQSCFNTLVFDIEKAEKIKKEYFTTLNQEESNRKDKYYSFIIDSWKDKAFFFKKSLKVGRVFTLLSSTPKIFRGCLQILTNDGLEPLFNCDIKSCQPLLLYTFYQDKSEESKKYKELVESGLFYETIINHLKVEFNDNNKIKYKEIIWEWAFGKRVWPETECIDNYFKLNFPTLRNLLEIAKKRIKPNERRPHSKVPIHLQKMESSIMVDELVPYCIENKINYLTIHDSILCPKSVSDQLVKFVTLKFQEKFNLTPNFDVREIV